MKNRKKMIIFAWAFILLVSAVNYIIVANGVSKRLYGAVIEKKSLDIKTVSRKSPKINLVVNSSGEKVVNENVSINVISDKEDDVTKLLYSFDLSKWKQSKNCKVSEESSICKISFKNNMNKTVYVRVVNSYGKSSYYSKTKVIIDKKKPKINYSKTKNTTIFRVSDNYNVDKLQYSNDLVNWDTEQLESANKLVIEKDDFSYKYVRVVDLAGNISKVIKIIK